MDLTETIKASALDTQQSVRENEWRCITSAKAGKIIPLAYAPLLREDRVSRGRARIRFEMMETAEMLMNGINVTVYAHFIPFLAFDRFNGLDQLNRSYKGEPETEGGSVIPFFETIAYDKAAELFKTMGLHAPQGANVNSSVVEAYNVLVNHRRQARSTKLPKRLKNDTTLAAAFWKNPGMSYIVPDFDQALIDGEVPLNIVNAVMPVRGLGMRSTVTTATNSVSMRESTGLTETYPKGWTDAGSAGLALQVKSKDGGAYPDIWAELQENGITVSLQNIELAKQTAAFAALRKQYAGLDDDYIIDLLMEGVRVPDAQMAQPILLDRKSTLFGYSRRYATDAANLAKSVTTGETVVDLVMRTPPMNTGGIIMITAEVVPEQLYERQEDHFLTTTTVDALPNFTRDFLDPEKVAVVQNSHVDVLHSDPTGTFGYAPLNHEWKRKMPNIGGKYHRQIGDPFDENRQRIWAVEQADPTLTEDFYLATNIHHKVFADQNADAFEITTLGRLDIVGNTVFGKNLEEDTGDYADLLGQVDQGRIDQTA